MKMTRTALIAAAMAANAVLLAGCGSSSGSGSSSTHAAAAAKEQPISSLQFTSGTAKENSALPNTGDFFQGPSNNPAAMRWVQLSAGAAGDLNPVVVNGAGFTLYRFDKDVPGKTSNCNGDCATTWPPVLVKPGGRIFVDGVLPAKVGVIHRADGTLQVTIGGWPAYKFTKDTTPGQTNGQGVGGTWFGVTPDGKKAGPSPQGAQSSGLDYQNGTAEQHHAPTHTGDNYRASRSSDAAKRWVQLTSGSANGLTPIVHDGAGFTLYRFDKDTPNPSQSNCNGDCATTWPPVLVKKGTKIFVDGVPTSAIGVVKRNDGTLQVTIGGWPVYRFSKDTGPGQTNGEGVGGTWFAVSPTGSKVVRSDSGDGSQPTTTSPANSGGAVTLGDGSVILDSGKNLTEPNGSVGVTGPGCTNLTVPFTALSLQLEGGPIKLWAGPDCTGTSTVVTGDVQDLSTIFPQPIASVRFGG